MPRGKPSVAAQWIDARCPVFVSPSLSLALCWRVRLRRRRKRRPRNSIVSSKSSTLILHRLDQLQPDQTAGALATPRPSAPGPVAPPGAGVAAGSSASETLAAGAVAIIHAAPTTPLAAHEIPADSIGGFIYTGGCAPARRPEGSRRPLCRPHRRRMAGLAACQREPGATNSSSTAAPSAPETSPIPPASSPDGWKTARSASQETTPNSGLDRPAAFSLVLGAELQPGLYKLRLWAVCTPHGARSARLGRAAGKSPGRSQPSPRYR